MVLLIYAYKLTPNPHDNIHESNTAKYSKLRWCCMAVRSLKLLGGGGQSEVQNGTLLMMMIWHQKKGTGLLAKRALFSTITGTALLRE